MCLDSIVRISLWEILCPRQFGGTQSVLIRGVASFQELNPNGIAANPLYSRQLFRQTQSVLIRGEAS